MKPINVTYDLFTTAWSIKDKLAHIDMSMMSFDIETKGLYSKKQRKEAMKLIEEDLSVENHKLVSVVANNSGLSFPSLVETTHFVFGLTPKNSLIFIPPNRHMELFIWNWIRDYPGKLLIHNTLFDLKVMYNRIGALPRDYEDTALMLKTLINNSDVWRAKVGLKDQMGGYYKPEWSLFDEYEPENLKSRNFLDYAAIDGAATFLLYTLTMKHCYGT